MRFRNVVTRSNLQLAQSGGAALSGMKTSVLKKLAQSEGLDQAAIDATDDEEDSTNATLVALISDAMAASKARPAAQEGIPPDPEPEQQRQPADGSGSGSLVRQTSRRQLAQAQAIRHIPSRDEVEKHGLIKLVAEETSFQHMGLQVLMEGQGAGTYCEFLYHMIGSYNEHVVKFESGENVTYPGWSGACHKGLQAAQMEGVFISGHPQERCDGEYRWRGGWHDGWPVLQQEKEGGGGLGVAVAGCVCYRGMGSRERRMGDAWVISDDDKHMDDEDWTGAAFLSSTATE